MLIPIGTDAPIYHWPISTAIFIFINICVFVLQSAIGESYDWEANRGSLVSVAERVQEFDELNLDRRPPVPRDNENWDFQFDQRDFDDIDLDELNEEEFKDLLRERGQPDKSLGWQPYALWLGDGLHPIQWLTSFFMHIDLFHLIGNMIFLMLFGLVVESRLGNWQFAAYYLSMGTATGMLTQILTLAVDENIALGASGAIYGVMATAMLWWPRFDIICIWIFWFYAFFPRIPILIFGVFYVLWDIGAMLFGERLIDSGFLHVVGAAVGTLFASVTLWRGWVDTEFEDFYSLLLEVAGKDPKKLAKKKKLSKKEIEQREEQARARQFEKKEKLERIWRSVDAHLAANNLDAAIMMERQTRQLDPNARWDESRLLKLIGKLQSAKDWDKVILHSQLYLEHYQGREVTIRLNLAKVLLLHKQMPRKVLKVIKPLESMQLDDSQNKAMQQILLRSKQLIDAGTLEFGE